jgi:hypothetical protein
VECNLEEVAAAGPVYLFLILFASAEFNARAAFRLSAVQTRAFQIIGTMLYVREKFIVHIGIHQRTLEERRDA